MTRNDTVGTHKTTVHNTGTVISVIYHETEVVHANRVIGIITLDSGGYRTSTTKARMNQAANQFNLGFLVYQKAGEWYVTLNPGTVTQRFEDGMRFPIYTEEH